MEETGEGAKVKIKIKIKIKITTTNDLGRVLDTVQTLHIPVVIIISFTVTKVGFVQPHSDALGRTKSWKGHEIRADSRKQYKQI